jgi:hypothetical protein
MKKLATEIDHKMPTAIEQFSAGKSRSSALPISGVKNKVHLTTPLFSPLKSTIERLHPSIA